MTLLHSRQNNSLQLFWFAVIAAASCLTLEQSLSESSLLTYVPAHHGAVSVTCAVRVCASHS